MSEFEYVVFLAEMAYQEQISRKDDYLYRYNETKELLIQLFDKSYELNFSSNNDLFFISDKFNDCNIYFVDIDNLIYNIIMFLYFDFKLFDKFTFDNDVINGIKLSYLIKSVSVKEDNQRSSIMNR